MVMPAPIANIALARAAERLPGLRRLPLARLVIAAELAVLAKAHLDRLKPVERRRLLILLRDARGMPKNLSGRDRREFEKLVGKLEPKMFASTAAEKFSPLSGVKRRS
jgi:hypothetical protein